ncbi:MAG: hypothetical protein O3A02_02670 [bacterium]|nr:hypothetical protein [bacterium]
MILELTLTSILTGLLGTALMVAVLNMPLIWGGQVYDTLGALGAVFTKRVDARSRTVGALFLALGGIAFATAYGWVALMFVNGTFEGPDYQVLRDFPTRIDLFFPILGLVGGFGHGMFAALITTFVVTDFHPIEEMRDPFGLVRSFLIGHTVFGVVVMFFQQQLLQLFV